ncbi:hypothetical protein [Helicobacter marmotae]|uniref:Uncharacterized protein n=1 Tax=Helicobacter marmotae TaxID=152490 RepID=A0A3D8I5Y4_9HELI|nr:hypothetical protein [Helicobacter marmotae]RDU60563.1 hypothetical protein CQA63_02335 [Helicobacter marmotae]
MTARLKPNTSYPEVHSLEGSLAILESYRDNLTDVEYKNIHSNICNFAIEDMHLNELDIIHNIQIITNKRTADEIIAHHKSQWGLL